jgi:hypothetical protein
MYSSSSNSNNKKIKSRITVYKTTAGNSTEISNNITAAKHTETVIKPGFLKFYKNDLIKGIIFSEILGKPRAIRKMNRY